MQADEVSLAPHVQNPPQDITFYVADDGDLLCLFVSEPPRKSLFRVAAQTRNPRVLARADDAVVDGSYVNPEYQEEFRCVQTWHPMAGCKDRFDMEEMMDQPALLLERLPHPNMGDWA